MAVATALLGSAVARAGTVPAAPESPALPSVLTLDRALGLLQTRSLDLAIADETVRSARADVVIAGALQNPLFSFSVGRSFFCGPGQCDRMAGMAWSASVTDQALVENTLSGKRALRRKAARYAHDAARMSREDARRTLELQVKQQFVQALVGRELLRFAEEVRDSAAATLALTRKRYQSGAVSEADVAKVEVAKLEAEQAVDNARQVVRAAKLALAQLLGVRGAVPDFEVEGPELLRGRPPARLAATSHEALLREALARRPDLKAAVLGQARADASLALARRLRVPDVSLGLQYTQEGSGSGAITPPTFSVVLSAPIPLLYRQRGEIQKAEADRRTQVLQRARLEAQINADVGTAWSSYQTASRLVQRMNGGLLERARRARDLVQIQYQKGAASLLEYLDAHRTLIATNVEYLQDLSSYWTAVFQLEQALATELR